MDTDNSMVNYWFDYCRIMQDAKIARFVEQVILPDLAKNEKISVKLAVCYESLLHDLVKELDK